NRSDRSKYLCRFGMGHIDSSAVVGRCPVPLPPYLTLALPIRSAGMAKLDGRRIVSTLGGAALFAGLIFGGAGTFDYWQGWLFFAVFALCSIATGLYFRVHDPELLERRMRVGPTAEKRTPQKIIMTLALIGFVALI